MSHFIYYYDCGEHGYSQCRCANPNKTKIITDKPCPHKDHASKAEYACASCANKDHRWDEMRAKRDVLRDGIKDLLEEQGETAFDPHGQPYLIAVPWRQRLRDLLAAEKEEPKVWRGAQTGRFSASDPNLSQPPDPLRSATNADPLQPTTDDEARGPATNADPPDGEARGPAENPFNQDV